MKISAGAIQTAKDTLKDAEWAYVNQMTARKGLDTDSIISWLIANHQIKFSESKLKKLNAFQEQDGLAPIPSLHERY